MAIQKDYIILPTDELTFIVQDTQSQKTVTYYTLLSKLRGDLQVGSYLSSVGVSMPEAFVVSDSPLTSNGVISITGAGNALQYVRGDGTLANFPLITGYVPYTGATQNVNLGEFGISSGYLQLDLTPTGSLQEGRMQWNVTDGTMDLRMGGNNVTQQIGQESFIRARNNTGSTLLDGKVVKITGALGFRTTVALAQANSLANARATIGILTEDIINNQEGFVTTFGLVRNLNTSAFSDGDILYLSTTVAGEVINTEPTNGGLVVRVGVCVRAHPVQGSIMVDVDNYGSLDSLSDVNLSGVVNNDVLAYDSSTSLWKNESIISVIGYTPQNTITLTTTGTSGAATLVGATLNIPQYQASGFVFDQPIPAATWDVVHTLDKWPSVTIVDSANSVVIGEVTFISLSHITIEFSGAFSGKAYLN